MLVTGTCSSSNVSAALTVRTNVGITTPPGNLTVCPGSNAVFTVVASGTGLTYQWKTNGVDLADGAHYAGVTTSNLTVLNATSVDALTYTVLVTGTCSSSNVSAALTVTNNVDIVTPPADLTVCPGSNAVFTVVASGAGLTYQWQANGMSLANGAHFAGVTTSNLTVINVTSADALIYTVVVNGSCDNSNATATLTVLTNVAIMTPPANLTVCPDDNAVFTVVATGTGLTYQWQTNGVDLTDGVHYAGMTTSNLTVINVNSNDAVTYIVVVTGTCSINTATATLTLNTDVSATALISLTNPTGDAEFTTTASGTGPITYQWQWHGTNLLEDILHYPDGVTNAKLKVQNVSTNDAGTYTVIVTGACGSVAQSATLAFSASLLSISLIDKSVLLQWPGEMNLNCSTNMNPPIWCIVAKGVAGTMNYWTNSLSSGPTNAFFRLSSPTP